MPMRAILVLAALGVAAPAQELAAQRAAQQRRPVPAPAPTLAPAWLGVSYDVRWIQGDGRCEPQVLVERVVQGSPAERAGLRSGDAIVALNGQPAPAVRLQALSTRLSAGDSVRLRVDREGRVRDVLAVADRRPTRPPAVIVEPTPSAVRTANAPFVYMDGETLVARNVEGSQRGARGYWFATPDGRTEYRRLGSWSQDDVDARVVRLLECADEVEWQPATVARFDVRQVQRRADSLRVVIARRALQHEDVEHLAAGHYTISAGARTVAGAEVTALEPELAEYFRNARRGLLVLRVAPESSAARGGLLPGDVIVQANGRAIDSIAELRTLLAGQDPEPVQLRLVRKGRTRGITLPRP